MPLTQDQRKHLLIGGGVGALLGFVGSLFFGGARAVAAPSPVPMRLRQLPSLVSDRRRGEKSRREDGDMRGEYGGKKRKGKHGRHHG